ncbi:hypothetical protein [Hyphomicrobium sulfonivorans]|nr:hypothetical protein [Hyphomicrobium sulfonivorans]
MAIPRRVKKRLKKQRLLWIASLCLFSLSSDFSVSASTTDDLRRSG